MSDKIWDLQGVITEFLERHNLRWLQHSRIIWRDGQPQEYFVSNQEYEILLKYESGEEKRVTLFIDDNTTNASVRSDLEKALP